MSEQTDAEFIAEVKALAEKATDGPWDYIQGGLVRAIKDDLAVPIFRSEVPIDWHKKQNLTHQVLCKAYADEVNNAAFIAAARTAIPRLIKMVEERERERDEETEFMLLEKNETTRWIELHSAACDERDAAIAEVSRIGAELGKAQAEADRLRVALRPFANLEYVACNVGIENIGADLDVAHFQIARAALRKD